MTLPNTTLGLLLAVMITLAGCSVSLDDGGGVEVSEPDSDASSATDASSGTESPTTTTDQQDSAADSPASDETDEDTTPETKTQTDPSEQTTDDSDSDTGSDSDSTTDTPADGDDSKTETPSGDGETETERPSDSPPVDDEVDSFTTQCGDTTFRLAEIGQRIDFDANETVIHYEVTNTGNTTAENVTLLLQGEMPLSVVEETVSLGTIEPGETVSGTEAIAGTHDDGEGGPAGVSCESSSEQDSNSDSDSADSDNETDTGNDSDTDTNSGLLYENATVVESFTDIKGTIGEDGQADVYATEMTEGTGFSTAVTSFADSTLPITIIDRDGNVVDRIVDQEVYNGTEADLRITADYDGYYYLKIDGESGASYNTAGRTTLPDDNEPDDSPSDATKIDIAETTSGTVVTDDPDYYSIELNKGDEIAVEANGTASADVTMIDAGGDAIASGLIAYPGDPADREPVFSTMVEEDGTYYLEVAIPEKTTGSVDGDYNLTVIDTSSGDAPSENDLDNATDDDTSEENPPEDDGSDEQLSTAKQCGDGTTVRIYESAQIVDHDANQTYVDFEVINDGNATAENVTVKVVAEDPDGAITRTVNVGRIAPGATKVGTVTVPGTHDDGEANPYLLNCSTDS